MRLGYSKNFLKGSTQKLASQASIDTASQISTKVRPGRAGHQGAEAPDLR